MKKLLFTMLLTATILTAFAQNNAVPTKIYRNELGIDATAFIRQYLNLNQGTNFQNLPTTYLITYRRHLKNGNIRAAVGGDFSTENINSAYDNDVNKYQKNSYTFNARLGWEFTNDLTKRWQVYYGVDFRPSFIYSKNDASFWNAGYANGQETNTQNYALAPLLGFRFKLINRLSLTTEASFSINWQESSTRKYFLPISSQYAPMSDVNDPNKTKIFSNYTQPLSIILTFDL